MNVCVDLKPHSIRITCSIAIFAPFYRLPNSGLACNSIVWFISRHVGFQSVSTSQRAPPRSHFLLSPIFLCFQNPRWRLNISRWNTQRSPQNTSALRITPWIWPGAYTTKPRVLIGSLIWLNNPALLSIGSLFLGFHVYSHSRIFSRAIAKNVQFFKVVLARRSHFSAKCFFSDNHSSARIVLRYTFYLRRLTKLSVKRYSPIFRHWTRIHNQLLAEVNSSVE